MAFQGGLDRMRILRRMLAGQTKRILLTAGFVLMLSALLAQRLPAALPAEDPETGRQDAVSETLPAINGPRDLMRLQGIDDSHFNLLTDGVPWQESENETLLKIIYGLHRAFRPVDMESWSLGKPNLAELAATPDRYRGEIFRLAGRVTSVEAIRPVPEVARRFELNEYYCCRFLLGEQREAAVVFSRTIPEAWKTAESLDARAGALAIFLKLGSRDGAHPLPIFVASRVAWYPPTRLGDLGMDVGLFDDLRPQGSSGDEGPRNRGSKRAGRRDLRLTGRNRECFYQMLAAAGRAKPAELLNEAGRELQRTGKERFSVEPLFNAPQEQQGRLVVLSGRARQVIPVRVDDEDIVARFGIDHYYQIALFTEDSQGNPLMFCVRELPEEMPTGEGPQFGEHVTVAGFFFNKWAYRNRRIADASGPRAEWQLAPLLIGRDLRWHPAEKPASNPFLGAIAGGLFVLALLGVWLALWRYSRGDKQFYEKAIAKRFVPESGASLDEIARDASATPDFSGLDD